VSDGARPIFVESRYHLPPNEANILEPARRRLELLVAGDNIRLQRSLVTLSFDGTWQPESLAIWEHLLVHWPLPELSQSSEDADRLHEARA
jgi:hypothetical protein